MLRLRQAAVERVSEEHSHLDLLLNVAGILHTSDGISPGAHMGRPQTPSHLPSLPEQRVLLRTSLRCMSSVPLDSTKPAWR